jgi:hypothetical protein
VTARPAEPGDADARSPLEPIAALEHLAHDLVAEHERELRVGELSIDDVQVGTADTAGANAEEDLPGHGCRIGDLGRTKRLARRVEHHRAHRRHSLSSRPQAFATSARCVRARRRAVL